MSISRREFLEGVAAISIGALTGWKIAPLLFSPSHDSPAWNPKLSLPPMENTGDSETTLGTIRLLEMQSAEFVYDHVGAASDILSLKITDPSRLKKEQDIITIFQNDPVAGISDVLLAFNYLFTTRARRALFEMMYQKRQGGYLRGFGVLPLEEIYPGLTEWSHSARLYPELVAVSVESRKIALELMKSAQDVFFEDGYYPDDMNTALPNAGAMAMLMQTETSGLVFIGSNSAIDEINTSIFASGEKDIETIAEVMQANTSMPVYKEGNYRNIPGSVKGTALSGGALGPQFMPINAILFQNKFIEANGRMGNIFPYPSLFLPHTMTALSYLYVGSCFQYRTGNIDAQGNAYHTINDGFRPPFFRDPYGAWEKWNKNPSQINQVVSAGNSFQEQFGLM